MNPKKECCNGRARITRDGSTVARVRGGGGVGVGIK